MDDVVNDWKDLSKELTTFQTKHKEYVKKLDEVESLKKTYLQQYEKYRKKLVTLKKNAERKNANVDETVKKQIDENLVYMTNISDTFPRPNDLYLNIILGGINVSILNREEKWKYKEEYEKFKFVITLITSFLSFILLLFKPYRVLDATLNFLLVWYYCTLTIRESILVVNGSKIKGWWRIHHFISTFCASILLIWPDSVTYRMFRQQFIWFTFYLSFVQLLQYYYQRGCLYRLRALGERQEMETTSEGFHSWMSRGLSFILPFLFIAYFFQCYNAYVLYRISRLPICEEWQVFALSLIFLVLFCGNFYTSYMVIRSKLRKRVLDIGLRYKYINVIKLALPSEDEKSK